MSTELKMPHLSEGSRKKLAECLIEIGKSEGFLDREGNVSPETERNFAFIFEVILKQDTGSEKLKLLLSGPDSGTFPLSGGGPRALTSLCWDWRHGWVVWR